MNKQGFRAKKQLLPGLQTFSVCHSCSFAGGLIPGAKDVNFLQTLNNYLDIFK